MEKKLRCIHVIARSSDDTRIQLTLSEETDDLQHLIHMALLKISNFNAGSDTYFIEHIDSIPRLQSLDK